MRIGGHWCRCCFVVAVGWAATASACVINPQPEPPGDDSRHSGTAGSSGSGGSAGTGASPGTGGMAGSGGSGGAILDAAPPSPDASGTGGQNGCDAGEFACGNGDCCACETCDPNCEAGCEAGCDAGCDAQCEAGCDGAPCADADRDAPPDHLVD